jgi:cytochrome c5
MLLALSTWFFVLLTMRTIHQFAFWTTNGWFVGWSWAAITTLALAWAAMNVVWSRRSILELRVIEGYAHWAIVICSGLASLGLHYIAATRSSTEGPQIFDPQELLPAESTVESLGGPIYGRSNRGKAWFALTCVTCHGPTGEGLNNLAPSLKESEFLKTADPIAINLLIRRGRAINDPLNKSGKPMPARGGDPTITDEKVADLVAFVMSMHARTADPETLSWEGVDSPPPSLSKKALMIRPQQPSVRAVNLTVLTIHGVFVGCVMIGSCHLLFGWMRGWPMRRCRPWIFVNTWGWNVALLGWLAILFFFGMIDSKIVEWLF